MAIFVLYFLTLFNMNIFLSNTFNFSVILGGQFASERHKRCEEKGGLRIMHNEEPHNLYHLYDIIRVTKSRAVR